MRAGQERSDAPVLHPRLEANQLRIEADGLVHVGGSDLGNRTNDVHERLALVIAVRHGGRGPVGSGIAYVAKGRRVALTGAVRSGANDALEILALSQLSTPPGLRRLLPQQHRPGRRPTVTILEDL